MRTHRLPRRIRLIAVVVGLVGVLVAADRVLAYVSAEQLAGRIACVAGLDHPPSVTVRGLTIVDQLLANHFREIVVTTSGIDWPALTVSQVTAVAKDVHLPGDGRLTIGSLRADLTIDYPALGRDVSGDDGVIAVRISVPVAGGELPATVYARPVLAGDRLTAEPTEVEVLGVRVPPSRFAGRLPADLVERTLPELPAGLDYHSVTATPDGLRLTVTGTRISANTGGSDDTCGGGER